VITNFINQDQIGFIKGRYYGDSINRILSEYKWLQGPTDVACRYPQKDIREMYFGQGIGQ